MCNWSSTGGLRKGGRKIFAKIMPENSPSLMKYINLQIQETWQTSSSINSNMQKPGAFRSTNSKQLETGRVEGTLLVTATQKKETREKQEMGKTPEKHKSRLEQTERQTLF